MKIHINKILTVVALGMLMACSEELIVDEVLNEVQNGAVLRNLDETNSLDIADETSTYSIMLEAQDTQGGNLFAEMIVNIGFNDNDDAGFDSTSLIFYETVPASAFTATNPTTSGLPAYSFSVTLSELLAYIGTNIGQVSADDAFVFDFEMVLNDDDGTVYNLSNATTDITATGAFSYFNAQFRYIATIGDPQRVDLEEITIADDNELGILSDGDMDTVFLDFDRDDAFVVDPTITILSAVDSTDYIVGSLTQSSDDDVYYFTITSGDAPADTIDIMITGAETVSGFAMANDTLLSAYIIDNVSPIATQGTRSVSVGAGGIIDEVSVELLFAEGLGEDSVVFTISSNTAQFDDMDVAVEVESGAEVIMLEFTPLSGGVGILDGGLDFDITTDGISDLVGNEDNETITVQIGN